MNIYLLKASEQQRRNCNQGFVIVAHNKKEARQMAENEWGDEDAGLWLDVNRSAIERLGAYDGEEDAHIVLIDFLES